MLQYIDNRINYNYSLCQQCGICEAVCPKQAISFKLLKNGIHKVVIDDEKVHQVSAMRKKLPC